MQQQDSVFALTGQALSRSVPPVNRHNLAVPARGRVLTTVSEQYARPVRSAVAALTDALPREESIETYHTYLSRRVPEPGAWSVRRPAQLLAWAFVAAWLAGFVSRRFPAGTYLEEAIAWFFDGALDCSLIALLPRRALSRANAALAGCYDPAGCRDLLPYILDPHGPGSRLSVRRDVATKASRNRKRAEGVYYTPADVADYMLRECLRGRVGCGTPPVFFDPACGTGVFLRAALKSLRERFPQLTGCSIAEFAIYGTDIDPWVLDAAAFVLLSDCLVDDGEDDEDEDDSAPLSRWHRLRLNLACVDALTLDPPGCESQSDLSTCAHVVRVLSDGRLPPPAKVAGFDARVPLPRLFPNMPDTGLVVIGNPPYCAVGARCDFPELRNRFTTLGRNGGPTAKIYPLFLEQMVRLAPKGPASGALVLPLSLACNVGHQFVRTRLLVQKTPGTWRFAFFDREPHALFGEDVKTRNAVLFWDRGDDDCESRIETGPLRKWRADRRVAMFDSIDFTPVFGQVSSGIPKIDGALQASVYEVLSRRWERLGHAFANIERMRLADIVNNKSHTVFVGATAYNFLNVFLNPPAVMLRDGVYLSEHALYAMHFPTRIDAAATFAVLSSHFAYWWWHATLDGFHVNARFLGGLPFGTDVLSGAPRKILATLGERLWSRIRTKPIFSLNRGRLSLAYSPNGFGSLRRNIDQVLAEHVDLDPAIVTELHHFTDHMIRAELREIRNAK